MQKKSLKSRQLFRPTGGGVRAAAVIAALCLSACNDETRQPDTRQARPVAWAEVEVHGPYIRRRLPGEVRATLRAQLSFEVAGRVDTVAVDIGDSFAAGDVLATIDPTSYELEVQRAEAALAEARAVVAEAESDFQRRQELAEADYASEASLDQARAALETARSRVGTAEASRALAAERLGDTVLYAPYAGEVSARLVEPSRQVSPGQPVLRVQGADRALEVLVMVPETLIGLLRPGSRHTVTFPAKPRLEISGTVAEVGTDTAQANSYPVVLALEPEGQAPTPGMTAEVAFRTASDGSTDLVSIPAAAFVAGDNNRKLVFVFDDREGVVHSREITIADIAGDRALVSSGLTAGERIATKGAAFLEDGQKVTLLGSGAARSEQRAVDDDR